ncbi:MAG: hypothetical protein ACI4GA_04765 [Acutalibacteraceae bacterium]|nr:hypothetical protein [Oscillospiraceae bacterium]
MVEPDTVKLLRECNAGVKMGVSSINEVLHAAKDERLKKILTDSKNEHEKLGGETTQLLSDYSDNGKEPNPIAKGMSWMKTNMKLGMDNSDATVADLITDGCNMGVKSLSRYLNQYKAAEEKAKDIAKKLIKLEEDLSVSMREFL